ncbi:MAG: hypothetical protein JOY72_06575, partial [Actinobacteria bacterium]|nr:hypothetical protein [Actinomycetota bacterium]
IELLEAGQPAVVVGTQSVPRTEEAPAPAPPVADIPVELEQLQEAWARTIVPAVAERSIPISTVLGEARPAQLAGDTLTVEFPATASFHRQLAEEPKNATMLADALYEVTGRRLALAFAVGEGDAEGALELDEPAGEDRIIELLKTDLDAREREPE